MVANRQKFGSVLRVLFLCNDLPYFMAHRSSIANALLELGFHVSVCAGGDSASASELPVGVDFYSSNIDKQGYNIVSELRYLLYIFRLFRVLKPDAIHTITIKPNMYGAFAVALLRIFGSQSPRLIMTFPGLGKLFEAKSGIALQALQRIGRTCLKWAAKNVDYRATFENYKDRDFMVANGIFDLDRTFITYGAGIDTSVFVPPSIPRSGPLVFLFASRLITSKGIGVFIEAARSRKKNGSNAGFLVAGPMETSNPDCFDPKALERAITENIIEYRGNLPVSAMPDLLQSVDVMCLPTQLAEGFPRILIEAAACGNAMLASRMASVAQIIKDGETGFMINPSTKTDLIKRMLEMESQPDNARSMGANAAQLVRQMLADEEQVNEVFISLYQ